MSVHQLHPVNKKPLFWNGESFCQSCLLKWWPEPAVCLKANAFHSLKCHMYMLFICLPFNIKWFHLNISHFCEWRHSESLGMYRDITMKCPLLLIVTLYHFKQYSTFYSALQQLQGISHWKFQSEFPNLSPWPHIHHTPLTRSAQKHAQSSAFCLWVIAIEGIWE